MLLNLIEIEGSLASRRPRIAVLQSRLLVRAEVPIFELDIGKAIVFNRKPRLCLLLILVEHIEHLLPGFESLRHVLAHFHGQLVLAQLDLVLNVCDFLAEHH